MAALMPTYYIGAFSSSNKVATSSWIYTCFWFCDFCAVLCFVEAKLKMLPIEQCCSSTWPLIKLLSTFAAVRVSAFLDVVRCPCRGFDFVVML